MKLTEEMKLEMFEKMLEYEHMAERGTYDGVNYCTMADGMYEAFRIMGIASEYIAWSFGK